MYSLVEDMNEMRKIMHRGKSIIADNDYLSTLGKLRKKAEIIPKSWKFQP